MLNEGISSEAILYFNFEDERIVGMDTDQLDLIKRCYEELYSYQPIFFLDEIQVIPHWEKFVRRLADQKYRVYVTGSNAKMLSQDIATTLGGRFMIQHVYPYSFREYLFANRVELDDKWFYKKHSEVVRYFDTYFHFGGLPELQLAAWLVFSLENYCSKIVEKVSNKKYYFTDNGILNLSFSD